MNSFEPPKIKNLIDGKMSHETLLSEGLTATIPQYEGMQMGDAVGLNYRIVPDDYHDFIPPTPISEIGPIEKHVAGKYFNKKHPNVDVWYDVQRMSGGGQSEHVLFDISDE